MPDELLLVFGVFLYHVVHRYDRPLIQTLTGLWLSYIVWVYLYFERADYDHFVHVYSRQVDRPLKTDAAVRVADLKSLYSPELFFRHAGNLSQIGSDPEAPSLCFLRGDSISESYVHPGNKLLRRHLDAPFRKCLFFFARSFVCIFYLRLEIGLPFVKNNMH